MTFAQLTVAHVSKSFGATHALSDISFDIRAGSVHGLVGENGAGKSTLLKVIGGVYRADAGVVQVDHATLVPGSKPAAQAAGVQIVHQELALLPQLTVAQNIFAGRAPRARGLLSRRIMEQRARDALDRLGARVDVRRRVAGLTTAEQQFVELARGIVRSSSVLILDEPTAALPPDEAGRLLDVMRDLAAQGMGIAFVSHRLDEILAVTDEVTILKDGAVMASASTPSLDSDSIVSLIVGRELTDLYPGRSTRAAGRPVMSVRGLVAPPAVRGVTLDLRAGEVVGLYGLEGSGQDEVLQCLAGDRSSTAGTVAMAGAGGPSGSIRGALRAGIGFMPPDRKQQGLLLDVSAVQNISLPILRRRFSRALLVRRKAEHAESSDAARRTGVRGDLDRPVSSLSGGNQQKILLARLLMADARVLLLNQPTRGVDIGAKSEIYRLVRAACEDGRTALVVSPEITELLGLCDRILVLRQGRISGSVDAASADERSVLALAVKA